MSAPLPTPSLRADLQVHERGDLVRVTSPATGREHLLHAAEWQVALQVNGRRTLPELVRRAHRLGLPATAASLQAFIRELDARGLLASGDRPPAPHFALRGWPAERQRRVQAALVALKEERYREARELLERELEQDPDSADLRALADGARRAEIDASSKQDEQWALAEAIREAGEGLALPAPLPSALTGGERRAPAPGRRRILWLAVPAFLAAALALPVPDRIRGDGILSAADRSTVRAAAAGRLEPLARDGDAVRKGDLLARLADADLAGRLEEAVARRRRAELSLQELVDGPTAQQRERARAALARAATEARARQATAARLARAVASGHASALELAAAERALDAARWEERSAEAALRLLEAGATKEALARRRADVEEAHAAEAALAGRVEAGYVRAPRDGVLQALDLHLRAGAWMTPGEQVAEVVGGRAFRVEGRLSELDAESLCEGLPFRVRLAGAGAAVLEGRVERLGERFEPDPAGIATVRVHGTVEDPSGSAREGMRGRLEVDLGWAPLARLLHRQVRHFLASHRL